MIGAVSRVEPQRHNNLGNNNRQHTVVAGDTISKIARDNDISLDALLAANPQITNPNAISQGQVIDLPVQAATTDSATSTPSPVYTGPGSSEYTGGLPSSQYTVVAGDTISKIARVNDVSLDALLAANPQITNPNAISVGQVINLPVQSATSDSATSTPSPVYTGAGSSPGTGGLSNSQYSVVAGDTFSRIAHDNNVTLALLIAANPQISNVNSISIGQLINIPASTSTSAARNNDPVSSPIYTGPGSSPGTGGLPPTTPPEYTGPGSSPGTGGLPPAISSANEQFQIPDQHDNQRLNEAVRDLNFSSVLQEVLNSEGDTVQISLTGEAKIPASLIGVEGEIQAEVTRVADGYEVSIAGDAALQLGLGIDNNDTNVEAALGAGGRLTFKYGSLQEAAQGVEDLVITGGKSQEFVEIVGIADELAGSVESLFRSIDDIVLSGVQSTLNRVPFLPDSIQEKIDRLPELKQQLVNGAFDAAEELTDLLSNIQNFEIGIDGGSIGPLPIPEIKIKPFDKLLDSVTGPVQDIQALSNQLDGFSSKQSAALDRLNESQDSIEITVRLQTAAELGIPLPVDLENLELGIGILAAAEVTLQINRHASSSIELGIRQQAEISAGAVLGGRTEFENQITYSQDFEHHGGLNFDPINDAEVQFSTDAEALVAAGSGIAIQEGVGGELTYKIKADELADDIGSISSAFLEGDFQTALNALNQIEGDLEINGRSIGGAAFESGFGFGGAGVVIEGEVGYEDHSDTLEIDDLTVAQAFEFLNQQVDLAADELQTAIG